MAEKSFEDRAMQFFDEADTSGEGSLDRFELCKICKNCGCKKEVEEMSAWFDDLDANDDNKVTKEEFRKALCKIPAEEVKEADLRKAFGKFDADGSGFITRDELKAALAQMGEDPETAALDMDENDDGKVNFEEFLCAFRRR